MALNPIQQSFLNDVARPHVEAMVRFENDLSIFVASYDALQAGPDALPTTATDLDDGRVDVPVLSGELIEQLSTLSASMAVVITPTTKQTLIQKMVRSLKSVLRT